MEGGGVTEKRDVTALTLPEALSECREALEACRIFVTDVNRIIEHGRKEPLNTTWYGVYNKKVREIAVTIDAADAEARKALRG
jgi:hypothetical protein